MILSIPGQLPGLNEYIHAINRNRHVGNKLKQDTQQIIEWEIKRQLPNVAILMPVKILYRWYMKDKRRDLDNVASAKKFINDALVEMGVIPDDGQRWVTAIPDEFYIDRDNPRTEIEIGEFLGGQHD